MRIIVEIRPKVSIGQTPYRDFSIPNVISDIARGRHKRLQVMSSARLSNTSVCFDFSLIRDFLKIFQCFFEKIVIRSL